MNNALKKKRKKEKKKERKKEKKKDCLKNLKIETFIVYLLSYLPKKIKASAGIEPATFRLLGERTAIYAKRPYNIYEKRFKINLFFVLALYFLYRKTYCYFMLLCFYAMTSKFLEKKLLYSYYFNVLTICMQFIHFYPLNTVKKIFHFSCLYFISYYILV